MPKIKKAQSGIEQQPISKSRRVVRSPDGLYKTVIKEKQTPTVKSGSIKETRTIKGVMKGAPKSSGIFKNNQPAPPTEKSSLMMKKGGKVSSKKTIKKK